MFISMENNENKNTNCNANNYTNNRTNHNISSSNENIEVFSAIDDIATQIEDDLVLKSEMSIHKQNDSSLFSSHDSYIDFCLKTAEEKLSEHKNIKAIKKLEEDINIYKNINHLSDPKNIALLDSNLISDEDLKKAHMCVLQGKLFSEHTAAGEATRLGLGTKYLLNPKKDLTINKMFEIMQKERDTNYSKEKLLEEMNGFLPSDLLSISLGVRHILQFSFDIAKLARTYKFDEKEVLNRQKMLIILNSKTSSQIISEFIQYGFFGFKRENILFMIQESYHGLGLNDKGNIFYDETTEQRLHNHGQLVMQETMENEIFRISNDGQREYLKSKEFGEILKTMDDKISYNIEDLKYLLSSIDYDSLGFALKKGEEGYGMLMEIVDNNPITPQKGGMAAYDKKLGRNVMIESFQLKNIKNEDIKFLNKNFNHFPNPYKCWSMLKQEALDMHITVKKDAIYFQPVQGDINFLVQTEFFKRKVDAVNKAWKSAGHTAMAVEYMGLQDKQEGFEVYAKKFLGSNFMD